MNKKIARIFSWIVLFLMIGRGYAVNAALTYIVDSGWQIIDTTAIKASGKSLNDFIKNSITEGNTKFYISNGVYYLSDSIVINKPNITIYGESKDETKLIQTNSASNSIKIEGDGCQVSNLNIDGTVGKETIYANNISNMILANCIIKGSTNNPAVALYGKSSSNDIGLVETNDLDDNNVVDGNTIYSKLSGDSKDGVVFTKQKNGRLINNTINGSRIAFYLCRNSEVSYNTIENSETNGIRYTVPAYDNKILYNTIQNTKTSGIAVDINDKGITPKYYRATNLEIRYNSITNSRYFGIEISNLKNSIISDNNLNKMDVVGVYLLYADDLRIERNKILNCNLQ